MALISARGEQAHRAAMRQLDGGASLFIRQAADELYGIQAGVAACIDYPEEVDEAEAAARGGSGLIVLTDERADAARLAAPMILATAGVHKRLTDAGLRTYCSIVVRTAETLDPHAFAVLIGAGATAVNAWLAQDLFQERLDRGLYPGLSLRDACLNYKAGIEAGLLKTLARKGISVISAYRGGCEFEVLGLSRALTAEFFPGAPSRSRQNAETISHASRSLPSPSRPHPMKALPAPPARAERAAAAVDGQRRRA